MSPERFLELKSQTGLSEAQPVTIGVLVASHNRCEATVRSLETLAAQQLRLPGQLAIMLVDDASTDGTSAVVRRLFPYVNLIEGTGQLYWGGGMRLAQSVLTSRMRPDYLLWLNDDVVLFTDALQRLLDTAARRPSALIVGALVDPTTRRTSYSGLRRAGRSPLRLSLVPSSETPEEVDTFNGNVVLVPKIAYERIGQIDASFPHMYGDLDYGYRAGQLGLICVVAPGHVGLCDRNDNRSEWRDPSLPRVARLRRLHSVKVMPLKPRLEFLRRHGGIEWPLRLAIGYLKEYRYVIRSVNR